MIRQTVENEKDEGKKEQKTKIRLTCSSSSYSYLPQKSECDSEKRRGNK